MASFSLDDGMDTVRANAPDEPEIWPRPWPVTLHEFELLIDQFSPCLMRYAFRRLRNVHDAEDAVQEVFVNAFNAGLRQRRVYNVGAYLFRMTANSCTDLLQQRARRSNHLLRFQHEQCAHERHGANPLGAATAGEEAERVERVLRRLPFAQAEAIRLRVFGELELKEIAIVMGCTANTVSSRLRYGFKKLRRMVARESAR